MRVRGCTVACEGRARRRHSCVGGVSLLRGSVSQLRERCWRLVCGGRAYRD